MFYSLVKNKFHRIANISLFLVIIIAFGSIANSDQSNNKESKEFLSIINKELEFLEFRLRNRNYKEACEHANTAANLIYKWKDKIKVIEPNYNWKEIRLVLLEIPLKHC